MRSNDMKFRAAARITLLLAGAVGLPASAAQFTTGDVIVGTSQYTLGIPDPASIKILSPSGSLKSEIPVSPHHFRDLNVHNDTLFGWDQEVDTISTSGVVASAGVSGPFLFDAAGNLYSVSLTGSTLEKRNASGGLVSTWSLPNRPAEMDLAADQCTLYYLPYFTGSPISIQRFNVCTSLVFAPLSTTLPTQLGNLRVLPSSDILIGSANAVLRISATGQIVRSYSGTFQIALDPDGRSFWATNGLDSVSKIDLAAGSELLRSSTFGGFGVDSLTVVGEPRAALSPAAAIPTLSEWGLLALSVALAAIATARFRS